MALRSEYRLISADFDDFLYAVVGEEECGGQLTVLSAFARLGLDPWGEAARLAKLTREAATGALAVKIASLPKGQWKESDIGSIAARLVGCLPRHVPTQAKSARAGNAGRQESQPEIQKYVLWAAIAAMGCMALWRFIGN